MYRAYCTSCPYCTQIFTDHKILVLTPMGSDAEHGYQFTCQNASHFFFLSQEPFFVRHGQWEEVLYNVTI